MKQTDNPADENGRTGERRANRGDTPLTETVREYALTLFDAVGFTTPAAPGHAAFVDAWLEAGYHGEMSYLKTRKRLRGGPLNSQKLLGKARSVIVVAQSYDFGPLTPAERGEYKESDSSLSPRSTGVRGQAGAGGGQGQIARYARGADYHQVMWEKLNTLRDWLAEEFPGTVSRGYTDSGPIRERELAARAGLGWQGKHTNLISLKLGNFFFLGALLTSLKLEPDPPFDKHHCGTCTRCIAACPTGAIVAPMTLDARRCISYLTIELHGSIPEELRPLMGDHIFGCDDCLAACPWNDKAQAASEQKLYGGEGRVDLVALLALLATDEAFEARFAGSPILRTGRTGLRRNVCVALGNVGSPEAIPALETVAQTDPSEMVREHAHWALTRLCVRP
ncbi:tRNA epoxyqueuosine(34) reductase QueG [Armatimonas rosea]|uniref:Epoxyqueuosine reductase n=1 Tax=Armatimonas rosea TaxID=685828 RepID=A0A7W9W488_ARMRO|nr:tRNA epoxyqueuosine(34) reductase QueG [Armatimonas rosea]MBB6048288.1 epoxyqueuosine reductase [Armatimonas rosea]